MISQRLAIDVLHRDERARLAFGLRFVNLVDMRDVRMIERSRRPGLAVEPSPIIFRGQRVWRKEL